ncbi:hypothetical protein Celal_1842 [Cellulophaga algicola DSM 14237]|uniref:Uncharacterized protein n=1 Tax=Cellulophaga algicola (strain DSM 14237 / IC166 / ACAM 630) TaxID=688270 RepID=E6XE61_CELAD|nr:MULTISPECIES: hypothetical protein [Cellulophaga]ADV49142.1 hypothetical protein Celal_1842 [Cellulophaga algicola DSM 14237]
MNKSFLIALFLIGCISCVETKKEEVTKDATADLVDLKKLPKKENPSFGAIEVLKDWTEYNALNAATNAIYAIDTKEDLIVALDDLMEKQKLLEASTYPEVFDRADIKSRQKVFKTKVLQVKFDLEYDKNPRKTVIEMVKAYNAFNNQFSVVIRSTLNPEILFDE